MLGEHSLNEKAQLGQGVHDAEVTRDVLSLRGG